MDLLSPFSGLSATAIQESPQKLKAFREAVAAIALPWSHGRLVTTLGYLNNLIYCAAKSLGIVHRNNQRQLEIAASALYRLEGGVTVTVPITYTQAYLKKRWLGGIFSRSSLRNIRACLASVFGLFQVEDQQYIGNRKEHKVLNTQRATYLEFDVAKALLIYEHLERVWLDRGLALEDLAEHKGSFCQMLYNAIFKRSLGFGRKLDQEAGTIPPTMEELAIIKAEKALKYKLDREVEASSLYGVVLEWQKLGIDRKNPLLFAEVLSKWRSAKQWLANPRGYSFEDLPY